MAKMIPFAEGEVPETPVHPDLPDLDDTELDEVLSGRKTLEDATDMTDAVEAEPEAPETTPEADEPAVASETAEQEQEPEETVKETETPVEPEAPEPEQAAVAIEFDNQAQLEIERAKSEKLQSQLDRSTFIADRNAGMYSHLKQRLDEMNSRATQVPSDGLDGTAEATAPPPVAAVSGELRQELNEIRTERVARELGAVGQNFREGISPFMESVKKLDGGQALHDEILVDFNTRMQAANTPDVSAILTSDDAKMSAAQARVLLSSAFADAKIAFLEKRAELARSKAVSQGQQLREQKRDASVTGSKGAVPVQPRPKTAEQMSDAELDKALDKELSVQGLI